MRLDVLAPLSNLTFVALDTETTGLSPASAELVEVAAVRFRTDGQVLAEYQQLIDPGIPIPVSATAVHGITDSMVRNQPRIRNCLQTFLDFVCPADIILIHNAPFDLGFLRAAAIRCGTKCPDTLVLDTLQLCRRRLTELSSHRLDLLVARFLGKQRADHRALGDAHALRHLFAILLDRQPPIRCVADLMANAKMKRFSGDPVTSPRQWHDKPAGA